MKKIYMITNRYNNKRLIGIADNTPLCDIKITDPILLKDIDHLYNRIGLAYIHYIKIEVLAIIYEDRFIDDILRVYKNQYAICGLYDNSDITEYTVYCIDTNKRYDTAAQAAKETGIDRGTIRKACRGERKTAGGHRWAYYRDYYSI